MSAELRHRSIQLEKLKEYERHDGDLERLRRRKSVCRTTPRRRSARARESHEGLTVLAQTVPPLARLASRRDELRQAMERGLAARQAREAIEGRGIQAKAELEKIRPRLQEAEEAQQQAADQATAARTVWQQAREHLKELKQLDGAQGLPPLRPGADGRPLERGEAPPHRRRRGRRRQP